MIGRQSCTACNGTGDVAGAACVRCEDVVEQCRDWLLLKCPPSVSGQGGHTAALWAASCVCVGFDLPDNVADSLLQEWNARCSPPWSVKELEHKKRSAVAGSQKSPGYLIWTRRDRAAAVAEAGNAGGREWNFKPAARLVEVGRAVPFNRSALEQLQMTGLRVDRAWLRERSAVDPAEVSVNAFLDALYEVGEFVICFTRFRSQGEFVYQVGKQWWKLGERSGQVSVKCEVPVKSWPEGVWFLAQPVTGRWVAQPPREKGGEPHYTRRSQVNVTAWRYMVVESDEAGIEELWLNFLAQLPLPIVALYTSGGKSVHALLRVNAQSKEEWDGMKRIVMPLLTKCGADKAVFSAVRLTRLPTFIREGTTTGEGKYFKYQVPRKQELLYLNARNFGENLKPIYQQARKRALDGGGVA
jgi:hypothetical protein